MATERLRKFGQYDKRTVGNINNWQIRTLNHGALCTEDIDNFTIVQLGHDENGERTASYLKDVENKGYLIASPERRYLGEQIDEFFNGEGERARIIYLIEGLRFESSAFELDGVEEIERGLYAHFNPETKKFSIHDGDNEDFAKAKDKFLVVNSEEDLEYTLGQYQVRFEVIKGHEVETEGDTP